MKFIIIDTETTGLSAEQDRVCEVGFVWGESESGEVYAVSDTLIRPDNPQEIRWADVCAVRPGMVEQAPSFADIAPILLWHIGMADEIIGYNLPFDLAFLRKEFARIGLEFPHRICTDLMSKKRTLQVACEQEGIAVPEGFVWHRALADATMTYRLWRKVRSRLEHRESSRSGRFIVG